MRTPRTVNIPPRPLQLSNLRGRGEPRPSEIRAAGTFPRSSPALPILS